MDALVRQLESQLAALPVPVALQLPSGQFLGRANAAVRLAFEDWSSLARLAAGQIGRVAEDYVQRRLRIEGRMRDLMDAAAGLLPGAPVDSETRWWPRLLRRAASRASSALIPCATYLSSSSRRCDWSSRVSSASAWPARKSEKTRAAKRLI